MLQRFIGLAAAVAALICLWPPQLDAFVTPSTGCHHNGTWYADRSLVPTMEKCLTCQCSKKTLVCRLKVCPEMPMPPPRGCIVVQQRNACCPYLSCARLDAFYKIPATRRIIAYLDHYERESIDRVVNDNMLQRRSDDSDVDLYVCVKNGTVYKSGSAMSSSNLCTYCYCIGGSEKCVKPKCMLPVEGCKPIFVDSTCCPVRYDCTSKTSGKSSQEVRYRKTSNKHFLRMSQRLQRNRGCTVDKQFYVEGQKMKSDLDRPCDICFCIRGSRRCAPKKCSPALKNCIPVVPKGQCCPSSYDCGSQRDHNRALSSRQFNLFSLLFGKEDESNGTGGGTKGNQIPAEYPPDRHPSVTVTHKQSIQDKNDEKSILDQIREGLEIIDGNNEELIAQNIDKLAEQTAQLTAATKIETSTTPTTAENVPTTDVSFLDLLLGTPEADLATKVIQEGVPEMKTTTAYEELSWVDLLLGPDDEEEKKLPDTTFSEKLDPTTDMTTQYQRAEGTVPNIDRIGEQFDEDEIVGSGEIIVNKSNELGTAAMQSQQNSEYETQKGEVTTTEPASTTDWLTEHSEPQVASTTSTIKSITSTTSKPKRPQGVATTEKIPATTPRGKTAQRLKTTTSKPIKFVPTIAVPNHKTAVPPVREKESVATQKPAAQQKNGLLSALLDGISDILSADPIFNETLPTANTSSNSAVSVRNTTIRSPMNHTVTLPTPKPKPLPSFRPLPIVKPHMRINSKIANLTVASAVINNTGSGAANVAVFKPLPPQTIKMPLLVSSTTSTTTTTTTTPSPPTSTVAGAAHVTSTTNPIEISEKHTNSSDISFINSTSTTTTTTSTTTTVKPLIIKTNPTILEADPFEASADPTLPPSLPNLKIIPFLPTDAVKTDRNKPLYDYYHSNTQTSKIDYEQYDEGSMYPAITERFPTYAEVNDGSKAEYIYKFNVEGPALSTVISSTAGKLENVAPDTTSYVKYDFVSGERPHAGFSPPTKTEGGFVPKDPLVIDDDDAVAGDGIGSVAVVNFGEGNFQVTKHIIDITTGAPSQDNTTKVIEITTPDPFKDVIRTEPPPDLTSLIEDKTKKILESKLQQLEHTRNDNLLSETAHLIHITTAATNEEDSAHHELGGSNIAPKVSNKSSSNDVHEANIATFLDLLLGGDEDQLRDAAPLNATSSTVPPFKTLPSAAVDVPNARTKTTKKPSRITAVSTERPTTVAGIASNTVATSQRTKPHGTSTRNKSKTKQTAHRNQTTSAPATVASIKSTATPRPKLNKNKSNSTRRNNTKPANGNATIKQSVPHRTRTTTGSNNRNATTTTTITSSTVSAVVTAELTPTTTTKPFLNSPFDTLPFMDASFEVKRHRATVSPPQVGQQTRADYYDLLRYKDTLHQYEGFDSAQETDYSGRSTTVAPTISTSAPVAQRDIAQITSSGGNAAPDDASLAPSAALESTHTASNSLMDPTGILKLAGCNIYGRMYRVGRIILELSSPCLECKCTEVGVKCGQLAC